MEHAGDRPDLAAQTDLIADIEPGELALRAGADHDLALAGAAALALDDLHVRAHRPGLRADAAQLPAAVLVPRAALDRPVGRDHQPGRGDPRLEARHVGKGGGSTLRQRWLQDN